MGSVPRSMAPLSFPTAGPTMRSRSTGDQWPFDQKDPVSADRRFGSAIVSTNRQVYMDRATLCHSPL